MMTAEMKMQHVNLRYVIFNASVRGSSHDFFLNSSEYQQFIEWILLQFYLIFGYYFFVLFLNFSYFWHFLEYLSSILSFFSFVVI